LNIYIDKDDAVKYKAKCKAKNLNFSDIPKEAILKFLRED